MNCGFDTLPPLWGSWEAVPRKGDPVEHDLGEGIVTLLYKRATDLITVQENVFKTYNAEPTEWLTALGSPLRSLFEVFALLHLLNKLYTSLDRITSFIKQETERDAAAGATSQGIEACLSTWCLMFFVQPRPWAGSEHSAWSFRGPQQLPAAAAATIITLRASPGTGSGSVYGGLQRVFLGS